MTVASTACIATGCALEAASDVEVRGAARANDSKDNPLDDSNLDASDDHLASDAGEDSGNTNGKDALPAEPRDGPIGNDVNLHPHETGDAEAGRAVFRMETFGNENFWTDVVQLPQGIIESGFTPLQALIAGFSINIEALDEETQVSLVEELTSDLSEEAAPLLNDAATTLTLMNANALIGVVAVDSNDDDVIDVVSGDKVGVSCALCHAITDASVFRLIIGGSVGVQVDGPTPHHLNLGTAFAMALHTRALYPLSQLALEANDGTSIGRAPTGLTEASTEAEFDEYFSNPKYYPIGMFDDEPDGNGAPMHIAPLFRSDLSAPYGSEGAISKLDNFSNLVYTMLLDLRGITTAPGRAFMRTLNGAAGDEIVDDYVGILTDLDVSIAPAIEVASTGAAGAEAMPGGVRVDNAKLLNLSAYMDGLPAPSGQPESEDKVVRGRELFRHQCTTCHNVDQSVFVPSMIVPMDVLFPGDNPVTLAERELPLNPVMNTVESPFDDKMAVVNASLRGDVRGVALPLLLDLSLKPSFLHDNSVQDLDVLLDAARGKKAPHPFYVRDEADRAAMIAFLRNLGTD